MLFMSLVMAIIEGKDVGDGAKKILDTLKSMKAERKSLFRLVEQSTKLQNKTPTAKLLQTGRQASERATEDAKPQKTHCFFQAIFQLLF